MNGERGPDYIYATPAQESYIWRLQQECTRYRCAPYRSIDQSRRLLKSDASKVNYGDWVLTASNPYGDSHKLGRRKMWQRALCDALIYVEEQVKIGANK